MAVLETLVLTCMVKLFPPTAAVRLRKTVQATLPYRSQRQMIITSWHQREIATRQLKPQWLWACRGPPIPSLLSEILSVRIRVVAWSAAVLSRTGCCSACLKIQPTTLSTRCSVFQTPRPTCSCFSFCLLWLALSSLQQYFSNGTHLLTSVTRALKPRQGQTCGQGHHRCVGRPLMRSFSMKTNQDQHQGYLMDELWNRHLHIQGHLPLQLQ